MKMSNRLCPNSWVNGPLLGFDLETTGIDPYECSTVDMALVLDRGDGSEPQIWQWLVDPGIEIPLSATAIHGINTDTARQKGVSIEQATSELEHVLYNGVDGLYLQSGVDPVCIYNAAYDLPILIRESCWQVGTQWNILDAMVLDKAFDTYRPGKRTLTAVSAAYGLGVKNAHRAAGDAVSAINVTRAIGKVFPKLGNTPVSEIHAMQVQAYREQTEQFIDYRQTHGAPDFTCPVTWPYDSDLINVKEVAS